MPSRRRRIREALEQEGTGSVALSFLDIVSAGFGGAIFLFVIFATLPIAERHGGGGGGSRFIDIYLEWDLVSFDELQAEALVELQTQYIDTSGAAHRFRLGERGAKIAPETDVFWPRGANPWRTALVVGYARDGEYAPMENLGQENPNNPDRYLHARIIEPAEGTWLFFANLYRYQCLGGVSATRCRPKTRTLKVTGALLCSSGNGVQIAQDINGEPKSPPDALVLPSEGEKPIEEREPISCIFTGSE